MFSFKDKKILITGHTGFKGSWLSLWLSKFGANLYGISLEPKGDRNLFDDFDIKSKFVSSNYLDICDYKNLKELIYNIKPEIVFHLAAQPLVIQSYKDPLETFNTNIIGTSNILNALRDIDEFNLGIIVTSDKCYENNGNNKIFKETDPMGGNDPYSASKGAAELLIRSYRNSFYMNKKKFALASVRAGNVFGGGDWSENRLFPDIVRSYFTNNTFEIRQPNYTRPWQYVLDVLAGYLKLVKYYYLNNFQSNFFEWNFGPNEQNNKAITVIEFVNLVNKYLELPLQKKDTTKYYEASNLALDSSRAREMLLWDTALSLEDSIKSTIDFYLENDKNKIYQLALEQIEKYSTLHGL